MMRISEIDTHAAPEGFFSGPAYEPPYESGLQDELAWHLVKYLRDDVRLDSEVHIERPGRALYTVDFLITTPAMEVETDQGTQVLPPRRIAIECGGSHTPRDHERRQRRDAALIHSGQVDAVYRLRGTDLFYHMEDCLYLLAQWEQAECPQRVFSERGLINLTTLATPEAKNLRLRPEQASTLVTYAIDPESEEYFSERHLWHRANGMNPFILLRRLDARYAEDWRPQLVPVQTGGSAHRLRPTG